MGGGGRVPGGGGGGGGVGAGVIQNIQICFPLCALAAQKSMTKWTYNWKSWRPELLLTFCLSHLDISSGELQG